MALLWSEFGAVTAVLLVLVGLAWVTARVVNACERRLITATGLILAGLFFVARPDGEAVLTGVGVALWAAGLLIFLRSAPRWQRAQSSRAWPIAVVVLLPPAFIGSLLLGGFIYSAIAPSVQMAMRLALG